MLQLCKFDVKYLDNNIKLVTDGAERKMLLVPKGVKTPEGYSNIPVINTPIDKVLLCNTIQPSLLRPLGDSVFNNIVAVTTYDKNQGHIDQINERMNSGLISYVGGSSELNYEVIKSVGTKIAFVLNTNVAKSGAKFDELGIPYVVEASNLENTPLGRMEWIKFMSLFFDKEAEANAYLDQAAKVIQSVEAKTKGKDTPKVAAGYIYQGKFSVRYGGSFYAMMHKIAGADYVFKDFESDKEGSTSVSPEDFYAKSINAEVLIYEAKGQERPEKINDIVSQAPIIANMKSVKNGNVWVYQKWWFQSVDKLHEMIEDEAAIMHPEAFPGHEIKHFYKISQ